MRFLYSLILTLALPVIVLRLWWRGRRLPAYRQRWKERLGRVNLPRDHRPLVWVHAVSVGETIAIAPVIAWLLERGGVQVLVTCMTPTGSAQIVQRFGADVLHCYLPYDIPFLLKPFFARTRPALAIFVETELWPNALRLCRRKGTPSLLINARLSEKSAKGYGAFPGFMEDVLQDLTHAAVQNADDAARFEALGLPRENLTVTGSIKFDLSLSSELRETATQLKELWTRTGAQERLILVAASTHAGEEELVLNAFCQVQLTHPELLLLLVPRHPDRFDQVANLIQNTGLHWIRRSSGKTPSTHVQVVLGDTLGEMLMLYGIADIAFVGGSLVPTGGHNLIEPAAWGLPLVSGPHLFNFAEVAQLMLAKKALTVVNTSEALADTVNELLTQQKLRETQGAAARHVADENRGALARVEKIIEGFLPKPS